MWKMLAAGLIGLAAVPGSGAQAQTPAAPAPVQLAAAKAPPATPAKPQEAPRAMRATQKPVAFVPPAEGVAPPPPPVATGFDPSVRSKTPRYTDISGADPAELDFTFDAAPPLDSRITTDRGGLLGVKAKVPF